MCLLPDFTRPIPGVRGPQFLSLLVKSMKGDASIKRVAAFAKRLLQVGAAGWTGGGGLEVVKNVCRGTRAGGL
jgi:hypothetical protein